MARKNRTDPAAPTLMDVAKLAGVSTATVSRCLNAPDQVVEATRKRVREAISELGYAPNFSARALAARRTRTIGAIIPTMQNAIFAHGIQAFQEELSLRGYTLLVASSSYLAEREETQIRTMAARGVDALLLIGYDRSGEINQFLKEREIPVAVAWNFVPENPLPAIGFGNFDAMVELADEVIRLGHRHLAMITAPCATNDRARARLEAVRHSMEKTGLDPASLKVEEAAYGIETGAGAFRALFSGMTRPTAVICGNDVLAAGALKAARSMSIDVPLDVSITGFDDIELATLTAPELTTVHVPHFEMGRRAAEMLVAMVEGDAPSPQIRLQTELRLRGTLAPPRA